MKTSTRTALLCAAVGALSYLNSPGGIRPFAIALTAAGAAFIAVATAQRETKRIRRNVTAFAKSLLAKQFPRYGRHDCEETGKMAQTLNAAARDLKNRFETADEHSARFSAVLDEASEGIVCVSKSGRVTVANKTARAMLSAPEDIIGRNYWEVIFSASMKQLVRDALEAEGGSPLRSEVTNLYPSENFYMASALAPTKERGEVVVVLFDLTEFKKLQTAQKDLVTNISHEIRTPLTSILGAAERISERTRGDGETEKLAQMLERNTRRLADLCSRIITLSELEERQKTGWGFEPFNVADAARSAAHLMKSQAERKKIEITVFGTERLVMEGDRLMIENMLVNLIENAVKYSPEGAGVEVEHGRDENENIQIAVKDRGEGIEPEDIDRIFERFHRASRARTAGGSGLGLSIARQTAQIHGGRITVQSKPDSGSVFTVLFPAPAQK